VNFFVLAINIALLFWCGFWYLTHRKRLSIKPGYMLIAVVGILAYTVVKVLQIVNGVGPFYILRFGPHPNDWFPIPLYNLAAVISLPIVLVGLAGVLLSRPKRAALVEPASTDKTWPPPPAAN
jgi:hypothetical protein